MKPNFLSAVLILLACWYLYEPVPPKFSQPWKLRAVSGLIKVVLDISWIAEKLGLGTVQDFLRTVDEYTTSGSWRPDVEDLVFDGVPVRAYNLRRSGKKTYPGLVYYHGGGWAVSGARKYDRLMSSISDGIDVVIVSVEYRLAGRGGVRFPAPLDDCVTATRHFLTKARLYGVDPERVAVAGDSAGGNLAAAVALRLRDESFSPAPKIQVLIYPALQAVDFLLPSMIQHGRGPFLNRYWLAWSWSLYATGSAEIVSQLLRNNHTSSAAKKSIHGTYVVHDDLPTKYRYKPYTKPSLDFGDDGVWNRLKHVMTNPYFAPLLAPNLTHLPTAYIYTPHDDALRDDGLLYSRRLDAAGVPVTHVEDPVAFHGVCSWRRWFPVEAERCINGVVQFLRDKL